MLERQRLAAAAALPAQGLAIEVQRFDRGVSGLFPGRDGKPCELAESVHIVGPGRWRSQ